VIRGL